MRVGIVVLVLGAGVGLSSRVGAEGVKADVEIYGTLVPHLELIGTSGATDPGEGTNATQVPAAAYTGIDEPGRLRMTQGTSHIGFRGSLALLGDDLKVVWQIESGVPIDGDPVLNTFATRNSHLGVSGGFGTLAFGIWDSPYKWATLPVINPLRAGFVPDYTSLIGTPGFNVGALNLSPSYVPDAVPGPSPVPRSNAAFYRRDANSVQYWTPSLFGLSARLGYTVNEATRADTPAAPAIRPDIFSALVSYDRGPLQLRYAFELHRDYFGLSLIGGSPGGTASNPSSRDVGQQVVASYRLDWSTDVSTRIVANGEFLFYASDEETDAAVSEFRRAAFYGLIDQSVGQHHLWAAYGQALEGECSLAGGGDCSTDGLGSRMLTLGYLFRASPVTDFYAAGFAVMNEAAAAYGPFPPIAPLPAPGAAVKSVGIGMLYRFSATASTGE
jgi:predicted porin